MADWSLLPKDLLELISVRFESCFEIVHFRSVCSSWRSTVPPPSNRGGLGINSLLPIVNDHPRYEGNKHCMLQKIPVFLLRFQTPFGDDYLLIGVVEEISGKLKMLSPLEDSSWRYKDGVTLNILNCQIFPLGHDYKINFYGAKSRTYGIRRESNIERVAFLPLDSGDGSDFAIVAGVLGDLMIYRSHDKRWTKIEGRFKAYRDMVSFKGKFYVVDMSGRGHVFVIEPSLEITEIHPITHAHESFDERLIVFGNELMLVQRFTPGSRGQEHKHTWFRLFKLVEEGQKRWVRINDLEDRVVFLGYGWNLCYSAKELTCMKSNCVMFTQPNFMTEKILVFDLGTGKTSNAITGCRGYMGAYGDNRESLVSCGVVMLPDPD